MATKHASKLVLKPLNVEAWGFDVASGIDAAITTLAGEHEVVSVATSPLVDFSINSGFGGGRTFAVIVTVVWREP